MHIDLTCTAFASGVSMGAGGLNCFITCCRTGVVDFLRYRGPDDILPCVFARLCGIRFDVVDFFEHEKACATLYAVALGFPGPDVLKTRVRV